MEIEVSHWSKVVAPNGQAATSFQFYGSVPFLCPGDGRLETVFTMVRWLFFSFWLLNSPNVCDSYFFHSRSAVYCSRQCQTSHWSQHKESCVRQRSNATAADWTVGTPEEVLDRICGLWGYSREPRQWRKELKYFIILNFQQERIEVWQPFI